MLLALSFVPKRDVQFALEIIQDDFPSELNDLVIYWEDNYVGKRLQQIEPTFPIKI